MRRFPISILKDTFFGLWGVIEVSNWCNGGDLPKLQTIVRHVFTSDFYQEPKLKMSFNLYNSDSDNTFPKTSVSTGH